MHLVHQPLVLGVWLVLHDLFRLVIFDVIRMRVDVEFSVDLVHFEKLVSILKISLAFFNRLIIDSVHHLEIFILNFGPIRCTGERGAKIFHPGFTLFRWHLRDENIVIFHWHELVLSSELKRLKPFKLVFPNGLMVYVVNDLGPFVSQRVFANRDELRLHGWALVDVLNLEILEKQIPYLFPVYNLKQFPHVDLRPVFLQHQVVDRHEVLLSIQRCLNYSVIFLSQKAQSYPHSLLFNFLAHLKLNLHLFRSMLKALLRGALVQILLRDILALLLEKNLVEYAIQMAFGHVVEIDGHVGFFIDQNFFDRHLS